MDPKFDAEKMMQQVFPGYTIDETMKIVVPSYDKPITPAQNPSGTPGK